MAEAISTPESTGSAPATPGASPSVTPPEAPAAAPAAAPTVPEKYEFKLAEGRSLDQGLMDVVTPVLKELGASQELASKLVDVYDKYAQTHEANQEKEFKAFMADTAKKNIEAMKKEWGHEYDAKLNVAMRGIARFLSPAGKQKLEDSGLGNDPEFMRAFYQAGQMIQEDQPPNGVQPPTAKAATFAEALYGSKPN